MTVKLRSHHLLCMLTYVGKGYSQAFTDNYDRVIERLAGGEEIIIGEGPDEICQPLLETTEPHCHNVSVTERDTQALLDVGKLLGRTLQVGDRLKINLSTLEGLRQSFAGGTTRTACVGCEWFELCTTVSADGYDSVKLHIVE
ncbi:DUF1284 domain-containing protein [Phyllobacterium sp. CCNWLW109]|uniref:DUF1284 domain-containing protein n=1 Tax=Phyllobacterium sp. CCNWLW109 TaxID=3127479 RepID=UPI003076AAED